MDSGFIVPERCLAYTRLHRPGGDYVADVGGDFAMIEPWLPAVVDSILDIGCGMAGIDVLLKRRYPWARLILMDGEGTRARYGWNERCEPYSSRLAAEALLAANGVASYEWIEAGTKRELRADLVVSLLSWGFHYPLKTYRVRGFCIADLARAHEPPRGRVIEQHKHSARCAFWMGS